MDTYTLSKEEYTEYLAYKKVKIQKKAEEEIEKIEMELSKVLNGKAPENERSQNGHVYNSVKQLPGTVRKTHKKQKNRKGAIGWREILEEILSSSEKPMSYAEIVDAVINKPGSKISEDIAKKSVSSNLGTYSKGSNKRYTWVEKEDGKRYYSLNQ